MTSEGESDETNVEDFFWRKFLAAFFPPVFPECHSPAKRGIIFLPEV